MSGGARIIRHAPTRLTGFSPVILSARMAGYKRALSRSEVRQIRRVKLRIVAWCAAATFLALVGVVGVIYLLYGWSMR